MNIDHTEILKVLISNASKVDFKHIKEGFAGELNGVQFGFSKLQQIRIEGDDSPIAKYLFSVKKNALSDQYNGRVQDEKEIALMDELFTIAENKWNDENAEKLQNEMDSILEILKS